MGRAEKKRVKDLVGTLAWSVPEMNPRSGTLPPNGDGLEDCAEFDVLPGIRAVLFPHGDEWRGLIVQFGGNGQVTSMMEHGIRALSDEEAPRWSMLVFHDILASVVAGGPASPLPQERLTKVDGLIDRV
ncbi:hypothetical protein [Protaetiibacter intestinalis]|uniref:Uncharacterized protein n=1 Tax=Protaetiibacter intestinalis TaxID=2419774 RepID=A0A387BFU5_9MICO|nr:hypothetical protein [Protaetiibacter intestinalis]AYF97380.1 hypothetical protein D7I47_03345 [Protaetiibacter intestinalis]